MNSDLIKEWYIQRRTNWDVQATKNNRPSDVVANAAMLPVVMRHTNDDWLELASTHARRKTPKGTALDYGCGLGRLAQRACTVFENVIAVDISKHVVDAAADWLKNHGCIDSVQLDLIDNAGALPVVSETIDHVYSGLCMHHIGCHNVRKQIYDEFARVMKLKSSCTLQYIIGGNGSSAMNCYDGTNMRSTYDWTFQDIAELSDEFIDTPLRMTGHKIIDRPEYKNGQLLFVRLKRKK